MPRDPFPSPQHVLSKAEARRFLVSHQKLWPPRSQTGKQGILDVFRHLGCIQFDPINVVGRNPDLVLQARIAGYRPTLLESLLYEDRLLWDGWDKQAALYPVEDWPFFARRREKMGAWHEKSRRGHMHAVDGILEAIDAKGPHSSLEFKDLGTIDWAWGRPASVARAALEALFEMGRLGVAHRTGSRRYYDLVERLVSPEVLNRPDPHATVEAYQAWHVLRRIGGLGLASTRAGEYWLGILGVKSPERRRILGQLMVGGAVERVQVEGLPQATYFVRREDLCYLESPPAPGRITPGAAFLGPLDNLLWDRRRLKDLFNFEYKWEVYTPVKARQYGYYVLPVLVGDALIARVEFGYDKKARELTLVNWWWEPGFELDEEREQALIDCFRAFCEYLEVESFQSGDHESKMSLAWVGAVSR